MIERGDRIAVEITIASPEWSGPVSVYKEQAQLSDFAIAVCSSWGRAFFA